MESITAEWRSSFVAFLIVNSIYFAVNSIATLTFFLLIIKKRLEKIVVFTIIYNTLLSGIIVFKSYLDFKMISGKEILQAKCPHLPED